MRTTLAVGAAVAVVIAVAAVFVQTAMPDEKEEQVIALTSKTFIQGRNWIDVVPIGELNYGDGSAVSDALLMDGEAIGEAGGICMNYRKQGTLLSVHCVATYRLPDGDIAAQGLASEERGVEPPTFTFAITGGTGAYKTAQGEVEVRVVDEQTMDLTFHLLHD